MLIQQVVTWRSLNNEPNWLHRNLENLPTISEYFWMGLWIPAEIWCIWMQIVIVSCKWHVRRFFLLLPLPRCLSYWYRQCIQALLIFYFNGHVLWELFSQHSTSRGLSIDNIIVDLFYLLSICHDFCEGPISDGLRRQATQDTDDRLVYKLGNIPFYVLYQTVAPTAVLELLSPNLWQKRQFSVNVIMVARDLGKEHVICWMRLVILNPRRSL